MSKLLLRTALLISSFLATGLVHGGEKAIQHRTCEILYPILMRGSELELKYDEAIKEALEKGIIGKGYFPTFAKEWDIKDEVIDRHIDQLELRYSYSGYNDLCWLALSLKRVTHIKPLQLETLYRGEGETKSYLFCAVDPEKAVRRALADFPRCEPEVAQSKKSGHPYR